MAILASVASKPYTPQVSSVPFTVAANATQILVTFTHPNTLAVWPAGPLVQIDIDWGNGSTGTFQTGGGVFTEKDGTPTVGNIITTMGTSKPPGVTSGTARITVLQTLTTAVLVESF